MIKSLIKKHFTIIKFLISGGTATVVDLIALYYFTDIMKLWYMMSAMLAFVIAFGVSFTLQKFWTFNGQHARRKREQVPMFLTVNLINLGINSIGMYLLVDKVGLWYIFAQIILSATIAFMSFFIYRYIIFKNSENIDILTPVDTQ